MSVILPVTALLSKPLDAGGGKNFLWLSKNRRPTPQNAKALSQPAKIEVHCLRPWFGEKLSQRDSTLLNRPSQIVQKLLPDITLRISNRRRNPSTEIGDSDRRPQEKSVSMLRHPKVGMAGPASFIKDVKENISLFKTFHLQ